MVSSDPRERVVPYITDWHLVQCDVNKDIEITDKAQLTLPSIQLKYAGRVFRTYVKLLGEKAAYRVEESVKVDLSLIYAFDYISQNRELQKQVNDLTATVKKIAAALGVLVSTNSDHIENKPSS